MAFFVEMYEKFQDLYLEIRDARKKQDEAPVQLKDLQSWEKQMRKIESVALKSNLSDEGWQIFTFFSELCRERIYILTVAAEEGWKKATEVAFQKVSEADKDLRYLAKVKWEKGDKGCTKVFMTIS